MGWRVGRHSGMRRAARPPDDSRGRHHCGGVGSQRRGAIPLQAPPAPDASRGHRGGD